MHIHHDLALNWPGKLQTNLDKRARDKYYHIYRDHNGIMEDYFVLKEKIEALIRMEGLQIFFRRDS